MDAGDVADILLGKIVFTTKNDEGWGSIIWRAAYERNNLDYRDWCPIKDGGYQYNLNWPQHRIPEGVTAVKAFADGRVAAKFE